jgi:hypothetical protein
MAWLRSGFGFLSHCFVVLFLLFVVAAQGFASCVPVGCGSEGSCGVSCWDQYNIGQCDYNGYLTCLYSCLECAGSPCSVGGDCYSGYCRMAAHPLGAYYCAQDSTSCVDNITGVVYQYASGSYDPTCVNTQDRLPCSSGSWQNAVSCGYSGYNSCSSCGNKSRDIYNCMSQTAPTSATCYDMGVMIMR